MIELLNISMLVSMVLLFWFHTDVFVEYVKLFRLEWLFWIYLFDGEKDDNPLMDYPTFLKKNFNNFFVKMITCPLCLGFWLSIVASLIFGCLNLTPIVFIVGMTIYYLTKNLWK